MEQTICLLSAYCNRLQWPNPSMWRWDLRSTSIGRHRNTWRHRRDAGLSRLRSNSTVGMDPLSGHVFQVLTWYLTDRKQRCIAGLCMHLDPLHVHPMMHVDFNSSPWTILTPFLHSFCQPIVYSIITYQLHSYSLSNLNHGRTSTIAGCR